MKIRNLLPPYTKEQYLTFVITLGMLILVYAFLRNALPVAISIGAAVIVTAVIGVLIPKNKSLLKRGFFDASVLIALAPIVNYLDQNKDILGWWSVILILIFIFMAGLILLWIRAGCPRLTKSSHLVKHK